MQQRQQPRDYIIEDQDQKPHEERMPRAITRQPEPDRFVEEYPDWFWVFAFWMIMIVIGGMGVSALIDMYKSSYNWLLALSWTSTAVCGAGGLALIQKHWLRR